MRGGRKLWIICVLLLTALLSFNVLAQEKIIDTKIGLKIEKEINDTSIFLRLFLTSENKNFQKNLTFSLNESLNESVILLDENFDISLIREIEGFNETKIFEGARECLEFFSNESVYDIINCQTAKGIVSDQKQKCDTDLAACTVDYNALDLCRTGIKDYALINRKQNETINQTYYELEKCQLETSQTWLTRGGISAGIAFLIAYIVWFRKKKIGVSPIEKEAGGERIPNFYQEDLDGLK